MNTETLSTFTQHVEINMGLDRGSKRYSQVFEGVTRKRRDPVQVDLYQNYGYAVEFFLDLAEKQWS